MPFCRHTSARLRQPITLARMVSTLWVSHLQGNEGSKAVRVLTGC